MRDALGGAFTPTWTVPGETYETSSPSSLLAAPHCRVRGAAVVRSNEGRSPPEKGLRSGGATSENGEPVSKASSWLNRASGEETWGS